MEIIKVSGEPKPEGFVFLENLPKDWWNIDVLALQTLADAGYAIRFSTDPEDGYGTKRPELLKVTVSRDEEAKIRRVRAKLKKSDSGLVIAATVQGNVSVLGNLVRWQSAHIGLNRYILPKRLWIDSQQLRSDFVTAFAHRVKNESQQEKDKVDLGISKDDLSLFAGLLLQGQHPSTQIDIIEQLKFALDQILKINPQLAPQPKNQNE